MLVFDGSKYGYSKVYDHLSAVHIHSIASVVPVGYRDIAGYLPEKMATIIITALDSDAIVRAGNGKAHLATDIIEAVDGCEACIPGMGSVLSHLCPLDFHDIVAD